MWGLIQSTQERSEGKGHCHFGPVGFINWAGGAHEYEIRLGELGTKYKAKEEMQEEKIQQHSPKVFYLKSMIDFGFELWQ